MKVHKVKTIISVLLLTGIVIGVLPAAAQQVVHQTVTVPGGVPGLPIMMGITKVTNGMQITWDGPSGYYQVFQKSNSLTAAPWLALGKATNLNRTATITKLYSNAFFRVSGPSPKYAGYKACIICHQNICRYETNTPHASAFNNLPSSQKTNPSCLVCHTVGYGLPTGFVSASATPQLAGVQCENCHGPAANHAAAPDDPTAIPRVDIAAQVCGGCHTGSHQPTYEEWSSSGHAEVVPTVEEDMAADPTRIRSCGVCHSGSGRLAMIGGIDPSVKLANDFNVPQTCAVCHNPHATNSVAPVQLYNPLSSTNNFQLTSADTGSVNAFTNKYYANTGINLCAQCHNDRGASWSSTSRAPHHSLQYNMLLGYVGKQVYLPSPFFSPHAGLPSSAFYSTNGLFYLTNQCASCHMQDDSAGKANHSFTPAYDACLNCHVSQASVEASLASLNANISNGVSSVINSLNYWAANGAPASLKTNSAVAWEYPDSDGLTWTTNSLGQVISWAKLDDTNPVFNGPKDQSALTNYPGILTARFNLYVVLNDESMGVHNPIYAQFLLQSALIYVSSPTNAPSN